MLGGGRFRRGVGEKEDKKAGPLNIKNSWVIPCVIVIPLGAREACTMKTRRAEVITPANGVSRGLMVGRRVPPRYEEKGETRGSAVSY